MKRLTEAAMLAAALFLAANAPLSAQVFHSATLSKQKTDPSLDAVNALMRKGVDAEHAGDLITAEQLYHQVLAVQPDADGAYLNLANVYRQRKDYGNALADYNKAIALNGDVTLYWNMRGMLYHEESKCDLAIADFNKALSLSDPTDKNISHAGIAMCLGEQKDYARAIPEFDQAITLTGEATDPNLVPFYADRGLAKGNNNDYDGAIADESEALKREESKGGAHSIAYAQVLTLRGMFHRLNNQPDAAQADITAALNIEATAERYYERGLDRTMTGNNEGARTDLDSALSIDRKSADAALYYQARGYVYLRRHDMLLALDDYDKAVALAPPTAALLNARCWTRIQVKQDADAGLPDCQAALKMDPANAELLDSMGRAYFYKHDFAQAVAEYDAALKAAPKNAIIYYHRGLARKAKGDKKGGGADIAHALKLDRYVVSDMKEFGIAP